tara:strand:+ start:389 stop:628 length:240 start_codon:yes stop_codon:yes gene_type:complete
MADRIRQLVLSKKPGVTTGDDRDGLLSIFLATLDSFFGNTLQSTCGPARGDSEVAMRKGGMGYPFFLSLLNFKRERKKG